jgi:pyruvate dehydrogenase E1 component alpha subunit
MKKDRTCSKECLDEAQSGYEVVAKVSDTEQCKRVFYRMLQIRRFEERAGQLYGMGKIGGFCHLYIGQEAVIVGIIEGSKPGDNHITSYRDHGHIIALGADARSVMAELTGKATGCSKGKGGSMHMFAPDKGFYGGHGIVGAQVSLGTGLALADKYQGKDHVTFVYYGDGAAHQGQVYESFNMAKLWKLPVVYVIENNEYAMGTSVERSTARPDLYNRGEPFGIPGKRVNGMDFFAVQAATKEAAETARRGDGPVLLEMKTYRYRGHSMSDPAKYRQKEEVEKYKDQHDPINNFQKFALEAKLLTEEQIKEIEAQVKAEMAAVVEFAENSPEPDEAELYTEVY